MSTFSSKSNPILAEFREYHEWTGSDMWSDAYMYSSELIEEWDEYDIRHWDHAMAVLTRLMRMHRKTNR